RLPFTESSNNYQLQVNEKIATKNSELSGIRNQIAEQEELLAEWKEKRDPDPPQQREETKRARERLKVAGHDFIPFFEAVEFQDHVGEEVRKAIEAAVMDAGLLDALITNGDIPVKHDSIIKPNPHMMAHTLADYLIPDAGD